MNIDDEDLYCTCDVGPFATCPVCSSSPVRPITIKIVQHKPRGRVSALDVTLDRLKNRGPEFK